MTPCRFESTKQNTRKSKKGFVNLTSRSSVMSTFSAPSKPDAFQPIKLESVERLCIRNDAVPLKKNPTTAQVTQRRLLDITLNLEQPLFVYEFKISTWPP